MRSPCLRRWYPPIDFYILRSPNPFSPLMNLGRLRLTGMINSFVAHESENQAHNEIQKYSQWDDQVVNGVYRTHWRLGRTKYHLHLPWPHTMHEQTHQSTMIFPTCQPWTEWSQILRQWGRWSTYSHLSVHHIHLFADNFPQHSQDSLAHHWAQLPSQVLSHLVTASL